MSANHMNLKRISHRIKEEVESTIEVAKVVGIKGWIFRLWVIMDI